jgi:hypothetical protein
MYGQIVVTAVTTRQLQLFLELKEQDEIKLWFTVNGN